MNITIPKNVSIIIDTLNIHGYEAYVVGGCVRDSILGSCPADWDITTSGRPEQVKALFSKTIDTGMKHGTVTVLIGKEGYEVTSYRVGAAFDDTSDLEATYADSLEEDLMHRDFTINAMAYHPKTGLIDPTGGLSDLSQGIIRCVGEAEERFAEDPLRMLRAVRFAGQFHFHIDEPTLEAIRNRHKTLSSVSAERIQMELLKLLISDHPESIRIAYETGLTSVFLPEFDAMMTTEQNNPHHCYTVGEHTIKALSLIEANPILRLTMLFHDIGKPATRTTDSQGIDHFHGHYQVSADLSGDIMKRLRFDINTTRLVRTLILFHDTRFQDALTTGRRNLRRVLSNLGPSLFPYLVQVMQADVMAQSDYLREHKLKQLSEAAAAYQEIMKAHDCLSLKELKINGNDLKALGITDGRTIGAILNLLLQMVLEHPELNNYIYLEELAGKIYRELTRE
ncbi:MAG: CCA tRNA nucleotidyltransferase [Eubacterium sp.]|nr:CCA tRNA nucleotidyltransferase [Eubacterium sp.]